MDAAARAFGRRLARQQHMRQRGPVDREICKVEIGDRLALAGDQRHRLAAKARAAFGQRRLVGEGGDGAEAVAAGNVGAR